MFSQPSPLPHASSTSAPSLADQPPLVLTGQLADGCAIGPPGDLPPAVAAAASVPADRLAMRIMLSPFEHDDMASLSASTPSARRTGGLSSTLLTLGAVGAVTWVGRQWGWGWAMASIPAIFLIAFAVALLAHLIADAHRTRARRRLNRRNPDLRGHDSWFNLYRHIGHLTARTGGKVCPWCAEDLSAQPYQGRCRHCNRAYDHRSIAAYWGFDDRGTWVGPLRPGLLVELPASPTATTPASRG
jgi:hypothetical protein